MSTKLTRTTRHRIFGLLDLSGELANKEMVYLFAFLVCMCMFATCAWWIRGCFDAKPTPVHICSHRSYDDDRLYAMDTEILMCLDFKSAGIGHFVGDLSVNCNKDD